MRRLCLIFLGFWTAVTIPATAWAASEQAVKQRQQSMLVEYAPAETFLSGNFVADEIEPGYIFGKVRDFAKSRSCGTAWLIEAGEKKRIEGKQNQAGPVEFTLYLEEDCPGKIVYYVFVDRSQADVAQWMQWRQQFHKNKVEPQYGVARTKLEQAAKNGFPVDAELRFLEVNGELSTKKPEDILTIDLKYQPIYDLRQGKAVAP